MTRFKLNARAFGGLGLLLIGVMLIAPLWAGLIETGIIGKLPSNLIQQEVGVKSPTFNSEATVPLLTIMVLSFLAFVLLYRHKRRRDRS